MESSFTLQEPLKVGGGSIAELKIREPTAMQQFRANKYVVGGSNPENDFLFTRELVAQVNGLKPDQLNELPTYEIEAAAQEIVSLVEGKLESFSADEAELDMTFDEPVQIDALTYNGFTLRPPKTGEELRARGYLRQGDNAATQLQYQMSLISQVTGIPLPIIQQMPVTAVMKAQATVEIFTRRGRRTGTS